MRAAGRAGLVVPQGRATRVEHNAAAQPGWYGARQGLARRKVSLKRAVSSANYTS